MAINWRDCIVPVKPRGEHKPIINLASCDYVWIAYRKTVPHLPYAIADTAENLARICGVSRSAVVGGDSAFRHGRAKYARFARVYVGEEE